MPATRCSGLSSSFLIKNGVPDRDGVLPTIQPCYQNDPAYAQYTSTPEGKFNVFSFAHTARLVAEKSLFLQNRPNRMPKTIY